MRRYLILVGTLLVFGISQIFFFVWSQRASPTPKPAEITQEATSTAVLGESEETAYVSRVVDGDTVELSDGRRIRYIGIDTPEIVHPRKPIECFGKEAQEENKKLVEHKNIRLAKDVSYVDKYGRLLRYVYVDDIFVNDFLVRQGFARASTYPPDVKYSNQFLEAEREARKNNRGLWASCAL